MSRYLVERIAALPNVELHRRTEIVGLAGEKDMALTSATFRDRDSGRETVVPLRHLFLFIGADPNTGWLQHCPVQLDPKGFVVTGHVGGDACSLETSVPGVFAIGDARSGSTKRVAAAWARARRWWPRSTHCWPGWSRRGGLRRVAARVSYPVARADAPSAIRMAGDRR